MAITRTYAVGNNNTVRRLDNHAGSWIDVSPALASNPVWLDVMTDPNDSDRLTIIGLSGIMVSHNAGVSWFVPGGNWNIGKQFFEVWYVDSDVIWSVGERGNVVRSLDGGLNFYSTGPNRPGDAGTYYTNAIHAISSMIAVVAGSPTINSGEPVAQAWKTIDGGNSWIDLNGGASLPNSGAGIVPGFTEGIWISGDQTEVIVTTEYTQNRSIDGGTTFIDVLPEMLRSGRHLTWYPSHDPNPPYMRHTGGPSKHVQESTDNGATWTTTRQNEGIQIVGAHFYSANNGYYVTGSLTYSTTDGAVTGVLSDAVTGSDKMHAVWSTIGGPIYRLIDCSGELDPYFSTSVLLSPHVGGIISINSKETPPGSCFEVEIWTGDLPSEFALIISVLATFTDCEDCLPEPPSNICWDLISCNRDCDDIRSISGTDFSLNAGLVYINGDTNCIFQPVLVRQAAFVDLQTVNLSNPASPFQLGVDNITFEITSLIINSTEYISGTAPSYLLTPGVYTTVQCTGLTCVPVPPNTTENAYENLSVFFNNVFNSLGLDELEAYTNDPDNCPVDLGAGNLETIRVQYRDGSTFSIALRISSTTGGTVNKLLAVDSGNLATQTDLITGNSFDTCSSNLLCISQPAVVISVTDWLFPCPLPIPPPSVGEACEITPRLGEPGFSVKNCDPKKVISVKTRYADSVYALFKRMRYGIETCCEFDLDRIDVSNMLIDLGAIYDPDICEELTIDPVDCCPAPCNAIAQIYVPLSVTCPAPINAIISTILVPFECPAPIGLSGNPFASVNISIV